MRLRLGLERFGLTAVLAAAMALSPFASGQEMAKRKVKTRVVPAYPELARQMNITGKVKIEAVVSPDGKVKSTRVIGGSPLLVNAALQALKNWRFEPAPKETKEIVEFDFSGPAS